MAVSEKKRGIGPTAWTLLVLGIGLALGVVAALVSKPWRPAGPGPGPGMMAFAVFSDVDAVLSTIGLVFLLALVYVYAKTYADTKARFALGLIVVLAALLFQALLTSPLLFGAFGHGLGGLGPFVLVADAFKAVAFAAFLYLSLQ